MTRDLVLQTKNELLDGLAEASQRLLVHAYAVALPAGQLIYSPGDDVRHVYLVETGAAAVGWRGSAGDVDVALIGREGLIGSGAIFGGPFALFSVVARTPLQALRLPTSVFDEVTAASPELKSRVVAFASALIAQIAEAAYANARFSVEQRVARWLLLVTDRLDAPTITATHDDLAGAVGCRRAGVTVAIHCLEGERIIRATRGKLTLLDRPALTRFVNGRAKSTVSNMR